MLRELRDRYPFDPKVNYGVQGPAHWPIRIKCSPKRMRNNSSISADYNHLRDAVTCLSSYMGRPARGRHRGDSVRPHRELRLCAQNVALRRRSQQRAALALVRRLYRAASSSWQKLATNRAKIIPRMLSRLRTPTAGPKCLCPAETKRLPPAFARPAMIHQRHPGSPPQRRSAASRITKASSNESRSVDAIPGSRVRGNLPRRIRKLSQ